MSRNERAELEEKIAHGTVRFPLAVYRIDTREPYELKAHWHGEFEIIYLERGSYRLNMNTSQYHIEAPALAFVEPGAIHALLMENNPAESAVVFDRKMLSFEYFDSIQYQVIRPILEGKLRFPAVIGPRDPGWEACEACFREILAEAEKESIGAWIRIKAALYRMIAALWEGGRFQSGLAAESSGQDKLEIMKEILSRIHREFGEQVTLTALARTAGMNPQYFCRYFKKLTGKTVTAYLNEIRIDKAAELLLESDQRIIEIAGACGYENMGYFIRRFKESRGMTPSQYRGANRKSV